MTEAEDMFHVSQPVSGALTTISQAQDTPEALSRTIAASQRLDEIFPVVQRDVLRLFDAEHLLLYAVHREKRALYVKCASTPLANPQAMRVAVSTENILGYCARRAKVFNVADVHDHALWAAIHPDLRFDPDWERHSGFRTRQMLVVPMLVERKLLMGVLVLINKGHDGQFSREEENWARHLAESFGIALQQQIQETPSASLSSEMPVETSPPASYTASNGFAAVTPPSIPGVSSLRNLPSDALAVQSWPGAQAGDDVLLTKIAAATNLDDVFPAFQDDVLSLFDAEQFLLYAVNREKRELYVKHASEPFERPNAMRVPIALDNPLGYCARRGKVLNIADVSDPEQWRAVGSELRFDPAWDEQGNVKTRRMLIVPMLVDRRLLMGVLVLINKHNGGRFTGAEERLARRIAETLGTVMQCQAALGQEPTPPPTNPPPEATKLLPPLAPVVPDGDMAPVPLAPRTSEKFAYLLERQLITRQDLDAARADARRKNTDVETILVEEYRVPKKDVGQALSRYFGCPFIEFDEHVTIDRALLQGMNLDYLKANHWIPLRRNGTAIEVLVDNPTHLLKVEHIRMLLPGQELHWLVGLRKDIQQYLAAASGKQFHLGGIDHILGDLVGTSNVSEDEDDADIIGVHENDNVIVRLANQIIVDAHNRGASDIHIEPYAGRQDTVVRVRVDGLCQEYQRIPPGYRRALVSRLKIMARLDISERRKPQDGKIKFRLPAGREIELRVAIVPVANGDEDVVMRILAASEPMPMGALKMTPRNLESFQRLLHIPYGLILVVGPTGSGKTTTLHSALGAINTSHLKIWTAEDPVEITQYGLRQVQVQPRIGFTFAAAMRAFLRADPDVIMVGEMRDAETAHMGIEASLTGHLVFSTLHTNSAPETVTRLLDMGLDPFNFADALLGVLAQRLARTLCSACKEAYHPELWQYEELKTAYGAEAFESLGFTYGPDFVLYRGKGCAACHGTGYKGRMGLHELLVGSETIRRLIQERARVTEILACAQQEGMTTLLQDGILKVLEGVTDFAQVKAVANK